jgi:hypothetical protein
VTLHVEQTAVGVWVSLDMVDVPEGNVRLDQRDLRETSPVGLVTRLENRLAGLEQLQDRLQADLVRVRVELDRARAAFGQPFAHVEALAAARTEVDRLTKELEEQATPPPNSTTTGVDGPPPDPSRTTTPPPSQPATTGPAARAIPPAALTTTSPGRPGAPPVTAAPTPTHQRPAPPPAGPQPRPPTDTPAAAAPAADGLIRITHTDNDTLVRGTDREDLAVRQVLKANRFTWSRTQQFWYLPRPWAYGRRSSHVRGLVAGLRELGRPFQVADGQVDGIPGPATPAATPLGDGPVGRLDQIVARATGQSDQQPASPDLKLEGARRPASFPDPGHRHGR